MSDKRPILTYEAQINRVLPGLIPEIREQVLADAKARIEGERIESDGMDSWENGYHTGIDAALAALTQPQTEQWHENDEADKAATAAGVADADLVTAARRLARYSDRADDGIAYLTDTGIKDNAGALAETLEQLKDALPPGPYAKAFRERVCPVPEFPSIRETAHEAIIEGGCCIQCGLPNNSETVLFHSCQAGAPADPTCPNTGHKFSHCDCDLGIEKEES